MVLKPICRRPISQRKNPDLLIALFPVLRLMSYSLTSLSKVSKSLKSSGLVFLFMAFTALGSSYAQETVLLEGQVLNDSIDRAYLHVVNLSLRRGTITTDGGKFTIPVRVSDTLYVSAVQLEHKQIIITPEIFSRKQLSFYLNQIVNTLADVNISNIDLSGNLGEDMRKQPVDKLFDPAAAGLPVYNGPVLTQEERMLFTATAGPVDMLIGALSGQTKLLKKLVQISNMERRIQEARNFFPDSMYVRQFNIDPLLIDDFMHYVFHENEQNLKLAEQDEPLKLIEVLTQKSREYKAMKAQEDQ